MSLWVRQIIAGSAEKSGFSKEIVIFAIYCFALSLFCASPAPAQSTPVTVGYRDLSFAGLSGEPTGEKPESKLWRNDGYWWGSLWDRVAEEYRIYRYDPGSPPAVMPRWVNTGTAIDDRAGSISDILWDGTRLYVASHMFSSSAGSANQANSARLYRYSYNSATKTYSLSSGFPVLINSSKSETLVLDKDSTGKLWITWAQGGKIKVNCSTTDDLTWGTPFDLPVQGNNASSDDISSVVAFGGNKIGIIWSNQNTKRIYFAVHLDGNPDTDWEPIETVLGNGNTSLADDHINIKAVCDGSGNLYATTKTSLGGSGNPQVYVHKRTAAGVWSNYVFGTTDQAHTRPILLLKQDSNELYVFAVSDRNEDATDRIYLKKTNLNNISFEPGLGTPFMQSETDAITDPTSTKQCVSAATGILVLANDYHTKYYFHNYIGVNPQAPVITSFTPASGAVGTAVTIQGQNFTGATQVQFNGVAAPGFSVVSDAEIQAAVPAGATSGPITVITPQGSAASASNFVVTGTTYTLAVNILGSGTVDLDPPGGVYSPGAEVALTAVPASGLEFGGWSGDLSGAANPASITMDSDKSVTATFFASGGGSGTVAHEETRTGGSSNSSSVSTATPLIAAAGHLYLAAISTRSNIPVSSVSGLGLSWTLVSARCSGRSQTGVEVWMAQGAPNANGTVTAILSGAPANAAIAVSRYSGVDPADPLGTVISGNTKGLNGSCSGGSDSDEYSFTMAVAVPNALVYGAIAPRLRSHTPGTGYTERAEVSQGSGGEAVGVAVQDQGFPSPGNTVLNGSFTGDTDWAVIGIEIKPGNAPILVNARVFLEGPYHNGSMTTFLNDGNLLPLNQPYNLVPWNYGGGESVTSLPPGVTDWVLVALRTAPGAASQVAARAAFLKNDGSIVDTDGSSAVNFTGLGAGNYYIVIYHRNHLAVMSSVAQSLSDSSGLYDFTTAQSQAYGTNPMKEVTPGIFGLIAGGGNADGAVDFLDKNSIWRQQNGTPWEYGKSGDFDLNGGIDVNDLNYFWRPNAGSMTGVPGTLPGRPGFPTGIEPAE